MLANVPNMVMILGYSNASWTLKADLVANYATRLIAHMDATQTDYCVPRAEDIVPTGEPVLNLTSGYVQRAAAKLPKQSAHDPWRVHHDYLRDRWWMNYGRLEDGVMRFENAA
jgi:hypothetical protein